MLRSAARRVLPLAVVPVLFASLHPAAAQQPSASTSPPAVAASAARSADATASPAAADTSAARSGGTAPAAADAGPEKVRVGIYVRDVYDVNLKAGTYYVDFDLWLEWTGSVDPTKFSVMNGTRDEQETETESSGPEGKYAMYHCQYKFHEPLDQRRYPLDAHVLRIMVEDGRHNARQLEYVPDLRWHLMDGRVRVPGWALGTVYLRATRHAYPPMNATDTRAAEEVYSHLELGIPLRRPGPGIFLKTFLVMLISVAVGFLSTLLPVRQMDARLGLGLASVFGVVSSYVVAAGNLPETGEFTLTDQLHVAAMAAVFLSILASVAAYRTADRVGEAQAERLDTWLGIATAAGFVLVVVLVSMYA